MAQNDFSMQPDELEQWIRDFDNLQTEIRAILDDVHQKCFQNPEDDDELLRNINELGNGLHNKWNELMETYNTRVVPEMKNMHKNIMERIKEAANNIAETAFHINDRN